MCLDLVLELAAILFQIFDWLISRTFLPPMRIAAKEKERKKERHKERKKIKQERSKYAHVICFVFMPSKPE